MRGGEAVFPEGLEGYGAGAGAGRGLWIGLVSWSCLPGWSLLGVCVRNVTSSYLPGLVFVLGLG